MRNKAVFLLALLLLTGCGLPPRNTGTAHLMQLAPSSAPAATQAPLRLAVGFPSSAPELQTARIALVRGRGTLDYYADARWADFLPLIVQDNLIKSIETAGLFSAVTGDSTPAVDEDLKIEIRHFEAHYDRDRAAPTIHIELQATLMDRHTLTAIGHFGASGSARAADDTLPAVNKAFLDAFEQTERQVIANLAKTAPAKH